MVTSDSEDTGCPVAVTLARKLLMENWSPDPAEEDSEAEGKPW